MVEGEHSFATVTDKISDKTLNKKTPFGWFVGFGIGFILLQVLMFTITYLVFTGIGKENFFRQWLKANTVLRP